VLVLRRLSLMSVSKWARFCVAYSVLVCACLLTVDTRSRTENLENAWTFVKFVYKGELSRKQFYFFKIRRDCVLFVKNNRSSMWCWQKNNWNNNPIFRPTFNSATLATAVLAINNETTQWRFLKLSTTLWFWHRIIKKKRRYLGLRKIT
jgi:hypothetical protein